MPLGVQSSNDFIEIEPAAAIAIEAKLRELAK